MTISNAAHNPHFARRHARRRLRRIHGSLFILASTLTLGVAGTAPASAQYYYFGSPYGYGSPYGGGSPYGLLRPSRHRPAQQADKKAAKELGKEVRKDSFGEIPKGPLQIFVSIDQQKLHLYSDGVHVADTSVATGVPSLPTPLGVFSIIQKQVFHRSNLYSDAPMPFMERITWSGVALHEGESIGHRASHGCIRMPHDFAVRLYHLTRLGVPVMIAERELKPVEFADPHLFVHRNKPPEPVAAAPAAAEATPAPDGGKIVVGAQAPAPAPAVKTGLGLRGSADGPAAGAMLADAAARDPAPGEPKSDAGTAAASGAATDAPAAVPAPASPAVPMPPAEPPALVKVAPASKAPIAIFVSRKEKKIYVRQDFAPLFQAPVTITDPDRPFGTLVFTALDFTGADRTTLRWNVVVFPAEPPPPKRKTEREMREEKNSHARRYVEEREKPNLSPPQTPAQALARLAIPQAALDYISQLIVPGSTLIVSDHGLGDETGEGTNFVVVLR